MHGRKAVPKGKLFIALEELKQLCDRSKVVGQHVSAAVAACTTRASVSAAGLRYARPSLDRAAELDAAVDELQICMDALHKAMAAANAAGIKVQGLDRALKASLAEQQAMDISGADQRELRRRGVDTSLGGGALERPRTALGLMRPSSAGVWSSAAGTPAYGGHKRLQRRPQSSAGSHAWQSPMPARPATATGMSPVRPGTAMGSVNDEKSFVSIMSEESSREIVQSAARPASGPRAKQVTRPPTASYTYQSKGVGIGPTRTVKPIVTARQLARSNDWAELCSMLCAVDDLSVLAGSGQGTELGEMYQLRGQSLARIASSSTGPADQTKFGAASRDLTTALSKSPWQPAAYYWRAICQTRIAKPSYEAMQRDMEACLQLQDPTEACAWFRLGRAQLHLKRYNLAVESASRALRILDKDSGIQQCTETETIVGLRSEALLCRGMATLHGASGMPSAAATMDFNQIVTDDPELPARWLRDAELDFSSVAELRQAFTDNAFVSQRYAQGLIAKGAAEAAVAELGRLLCLQNNDARLLRRWALSERLRLMALHLPPPSELALQMMTEDRAELVETATAGKVQEPADATATELAAEVHLARASARAVPSPRRREALAAWDRAKALPGATYEVVKALDTAGTPDYLLGRLAWGNAAQDVEAERCAKAHFVKSWSEGYRYTVRSAPEILGCLAAARLADCFAPAADVSSSGADAGTGIPSLASLAIVAAVKEISKDRAARGVPEATSADSLHLALLLITSPSVVSADAFRAIPSKLKKKWSQDQIDAEARAMAAAEADIALAHQHLAVSAMHQFPSRLQMEFCSHCNTQSRTLDLTTICDNCWAQRAGTTVSSAHVPVTSATPAILAACLDRAKKTGRLQPPGEGSAPSLT